jgi:folate-dependent phosphoribosylglycinamide formyltransferase PurN
LKAPERLTIVVLSCGDLGISVANALRGLPAVREVFLIMAPYRRSRRSLRGKFRHLYRTQGLPGFVSVAMAKLRTIFRGSAERGDNNSLTPRLSSDVERLDFPAFEDPECIEAMRTRSPDLGVVVGTYVLPQTVFDIPRLGSINLHTGKVPEYRGAAPVFWELYNGEREVGITIHQVVAALDAGSVLLQETFPLDPAPSGDPLSYIDEYRRKVLQPNGIRMIAETVARIANGTLEPKPQDAGRSKTYRTPDYTAVRALRARIAERRRASISRVAT